MVTVTAFITYFIYLFYPYFTTQQHIIVPESNNNKDYPVLLLEWQLYSSIVFVNLPICLLAVCINADECACSSSHRRGGGGGVPRGRKGHGTAGGSGVRRGPDRPLRHHLLLTHPGNSVK